MTLESDEGLDAGAEATDVSVWVFQRVSSWFPSRRSRGPWSYRETLVTRNLELTLADKRGAENQI